jgi:DUF1680 family protein
MPALVAAGERRAGRPATLEVAMTLPVLMVLLTAAPAAGADALVPLGLREVKVRGEIGRRIDVTIYNNLLVLDAEKDFLLPFETHNARASYIGLGKLILAAARFAAYTGDPKVEALEKRLVDRLLATREPDGYMGIFPAPKRVRTLWDVHEVGYLIAGLVADYEYFGRKQSLAGARQAADYLIAHWDEIPADWGVRTGVATFVGVTGLERTMLALHRACGDRRYLDFVLRQRALEAWSQPIVIGRRPGIEGHIYAYMARSLAQLELYRQRPSPALLANAARAVEFLTRGEGMAITGAAGQYEIWTDDQDGRGQLGETCATAYQIRVYESLLRMGGEARYGDLMERAIYNTLFAAQSPDGRRIRYYSPFEGPRVYHPGDTYCCPCNFRRIVAELPEFVYYRAGRGVAVNLYTDSSATLEAGGVKVALRQETAYPSAGEVTLRVDPARPATFPVKLRIPAWAAGATVRVNDGAAAPAPAGRFFEIARAWKAGDVVRLSAPMPVRLVKGRQRQAGRVAAMRGPLVYCLNPGSEKALAGLDGADLGRFTLTLAALEAGDDASVRPQGTLVRAGAWKPGYSTQGKPELTLRLTEFADPGGVATYFRLRDMSLAVEDELARPR